MSPTSIDQKLCKAPECRARIMWAVSAQTGKRVPLDVEPLKLGDALNDAAHIFYLDLGGRAVTWTPATMRDVGDLHRSHYRTCAQPNRF